MLPNCRKQMLSVTPKCPHANERKKLKALFLGHLINRDVVKTK